MPAPSRPRRTSAKRSPVRRRGGASVTHFPLRWHHGLGALIAVSLIGAVLANYLSYLPRTRAATYSVIWNDTGDFTNNDVTSQGATTLTNIATSSGGSVTLSLASTSPSFTESFNNTTNIDTGSSTVTISGGSISAGTSTWTQTDWSSGLGDSTANQYSTSTSVATSSGAFTVASSGYSLTGGTWTYRKKITFDNSASSENLSNFPVLVQLDSSDLDFSRAQSDGDDIRFTDSDESTLLSYELENWNNGSSTAQFWVKVPQVDNSATDYIYMYYGNTGASAGYASSSVWDSNYKAVYHMDQAPDNNTGTYEIFDSTSNAAHLTTRNGTAGSRKAEKIGNGLDLTATNDHLEASSTSVLDFSGTTAVTYEVWVKGGSQNGYMYYFSKINGSAAGVALYVGGSGAGAQMVLNNSVTSASSTPWNSAWHLHTATYDGSTMRVYIDGNEDTTAAKTGNISSSDTKFAIGALYTDTSMVEAHYDEARVSNVTRSASWVRASYKTMSDVFNTFGSEEQNAAAGSATVTSNIFDTNGSSDWGTVTFTTTNTASTTVKVRTSNSASMSGATAFSSCNAITSGTDISSNNCVTDGHRYAQYQVTVQAGATFQDITVNFSSTGGSYTAQSNTIDGLSTNIAYATLSASSTPGSGSITYYLSNNGTTYATTTAGSQLTFSTTGSSLKWKIGLTGDATVQNIVIAYNGYNSTGTITNLKVDAGSDAIWSTISWNASTTSGTTDVKFRTRGATSAQGSGALASASWSSYYATSSQSATVRDSGGSTNPTFRYFEIEAYLDSGSNGGATPTLGSITVSYAINISPQFDASYGTNGIVVTQITTSTDANWGNVRTIYSVRDTDALSGSVTPGYITPSFEYRLSATSSWVSITSGYLSSGATSNKTVSETVYSATSTTVNASTTSMLWDAKAQIGAGTFANAAQIRVTVDDNEAALNSTTSISAAFTIDTAVPVATSTLDASGSTDVLTFTITDGSLTDYRISTSSIATSSNAVSWTSLNASSTTNASTTLTLTGAPNEQVLYLQMRDAYGNFTTNTVVVPAILSANQTSLNLKDISNPAANEYKEFVSWNTYVTTSSATFASYQLFRSTSGTFNSTPYATITSSSTNSYTDTGLSSSTTYYYKVRFVDTDGDISEFSATGNDQPDGQGGTDITAPTISSIATSSLYTSSVIITWTTDELATSTVQYGTTSGSYGSSTSKSTYALSHSLSLTGLAPSTTYYYRVKATDISANTTTGSERTFTTPGGPLISNVTVRGVSDATSTIRWTTDKASDSRVTYSTNSSLSGSTSVTSSTLVASPFEHVIELGGLSASTLYYYQVGSQDSDSNLAVDANGGSYYTFTTTRDTKPPVISNIQTPVISSNSAVITWTTDEQSTSQVEYGTTASTTSGSYASITTRDNALTISHVVSLSGLSTSTTYYFRAKSNDLNSSGETTASNETSFTTTSGDVTITRTVNQVSGGGQLPPPPKDATAPKVTNVVVGRVSAFEATISFDADESSVAFIAYGDSAKYGYTAGSQSYAKHHDMTLKGLRMGTEYHYQVRAIDQAGNTAVQDDATFKTPYLAEQTSRLVTLDNLEDAQKEIENVIESIIPSVVPPFIEAPKVTDITETSATVSWKTNVPAYSVAAYAAEEQYSALSATPYVQEVSQTDTKMTEHSLVLSGLSSNTKYHFQVKSFSIPKAVGRSDDFTFITKAARIRPAISKINNKSISLVWVTDEPTTSVVEYRNLKTGVARQVLDDRETSNHAVVLENLTPDTPYSISVSGRNAKGNAIEAAEPLRVATNRDVSPPQISGLKVENSFIPGRNDIIQTVVGWATDEPATTVVEYKEGSSRASDEFPNKEEDARTLTSEHVTILTKLRPGQIYQIRVSSTDEAGNRTAFPVRMIVTPRQEESVFNVVIKNFEDTFRFVNKLR